MPSITKIVAGLLLALPLFSADMNAMQKSMFAMEEGLGSIQKGFLYNNPLLILDGLKSVNEASQLFKKEDMKSYLPKERQHMANIANNSSIRMEEALAKMEEYVKAKEYVKAQQQCADILNSCTTCHALVRGW